MRVGLFSTGAADFVNRIHEGLERGGHNLAVLVISRYTGTGRPFSRIAVRRAVDVDPSIPILVTDRLEPVHAALVAFDLDLILVQMFPRRLPPSILAIPRLGCVNVHPSLLPRYRGPDPVGWQLYNGESQLGITCHRMDAAFDTGPILLQWTLPIHPDDNRQSVRRTINDQIIQRLPELLGLVEAGAPGRPQDDAGASYAPLFTERERTIDWDRSAREIVNQIRAVGDVGAAATLDGREYRITRATAPTEADLAPATGDGHSPGTVIQATESSMLVATGAGLLQILGFQIR